MRVLSREREPAGREEVQHRTEREEVSTLVAVAAFDLFRRHVPRRAEDLTGRREALRVDHLRDAEVRQLHASRLVDQHVLRLHVAVNDAFRVGRRERLGEGDPEARNHLRWDVGALVRELPEGRPGEELCGDVALAVVFPTEIVNLEDRWMMEPRDAPGLPGEPRARLSRLLQMGMQDFDRDVAIEHGVAGTVDGGHAAMADLLEDLVLLELSEHRQDPPPARVAGE